ncbi:MAG: hypothetical protein J7J61_09435 [Candidatus Hydrothermae bacterium]|nr:hypothetical protein [Candidatus Hydrothermae bacterium]
MVFFIIGRVNSGKSTKLLGLYKRKKCGDGFILKKVHVKQKLWGYRIRRLSTEEEEDFATWRDNIPKKWHEAFVYGPFSFSKKGIEFADKIVDEIISKGIEPVFIDEIGPLEVEEKGLYAVIKKVLSLDKTVYITVREDVFAEAVEKFGIKEYKVLKL